jgi:metallophosphoesterase superfamily enzyme
MSLPTHTELRPGAIADCSGALYLEGSAALVVADAHLGYTWAQRRRGELGPLTDGGVGERLRRVMDRWHPRELVFLGDVVHLGRPTDAERQAIEGVLLEMADRARLTLVLGNHDRHFQRDFGHLGLATAERWEDDSVLAVHGDKAWPETAKWLAMGHLHPAIGLEDAVGVTRRLPVFVAGEKALLLPAFSPFAAGFDLRKPLGPEWRLLFGEDPVTLVAITGQQARLLPRPYILRYETAATKR